MYNFQYLPKLNTRPNRPPPTHPKKSCSFTNYKNYNKKNCSLKI